MRVRTTIAGTARSVRLTAIGWGALAIIASVVISGCTSASSTTPPAIFTPSVSVSGSVTVTASGTAVVSPSSGDSPSPVVTTTTTTATPTPTLTTTATATPTPTVTRTVTAYPTAAPVTGGGGTAGFQGALLLVVGIAAILAGAVGITYRRRLRRR
jgi:hypothetical protein